MYYSMQAWLVVDTKRQCRKLMKARRVTDDDIARYKWLKNQADICMDFILDGPWMNCP